MQVRGARVVGTDRIVDITVGSGQIRDIAAASTWQGTWVMPGLWDFHVHPTEWASAAHRLDLSTTTNAGEVLKAVATAINAQRSSSTGARDCDLVGTGMWHSRWPDQFGSTEGPTRADLDAVTGSVPTILISGDLHSAWFNSEAAKKYNLDVDSVGLASEAEWFARLAHVGVTDEITVDGWVREAGVRAAARGIVGIVDFDSRDTHVAWRRRMSGGFSTHRVRAAVWPAFLDHALSAKLRTGDLLSDTKGLVEMGPLKIISDGSLNTQTAWCHQPYPDGSRGAANLPELHLRSLMSAAKAGGIESAIHAIGDRANEAALNAFEATGALGSIEHAQLLTDADISRFAALGVRASVQPVHLLDDRDVAEVVWAGHTDRAYRFADLKRAGVPLQFGSDAPVAPLDPWAAIAAAVTRTADSRPAWHQEQIIDRFSALAASTAEPQISLGGPADLVVLGEDPMAIPPDEIREIPVLLTLCAGTITHERS